MKQPVNIKRTLLLLFAAVCSSVATAQYSGSGQQLTWEQITADAQGQTVNFYMWGGADFINNYVSSWIGDQALENYGINLRRVGVSDTADAVNVILTETEAGKTEDGSVDMIWINGENFRTLQQAELLFCGYGDVLPSSRHLDLQAPIHAHDFGTPVEGCEIPWSQTQFAFAYDLVRVSNPPASMAELLAWIKDNPGQFTYPAPPDFTGSVFVRHVFYHAAGGPERLLGPFNQQVFDEVSAKAWQILNDIEPHLWRSGTTYPANITALQSLYANQEVDFFFSYSPSTFGKLVDDGIFPDSTRSFGLQDGTIGNTNFVAIPANSPHKAAAIVIAELLLSPAAQLEKAKPSVWGASTVLDLQLLPSEIQSQFTSLPSHASVVPATELSRASLPELQAGWLTAIEQGWQEHVARN